MKGKGVNYTLWLCVIAFLPTVSLGCALIYMCIGPVNIVNLQDITTQNDLKNQSAVFAFDTHPRISPIVALGYRIQIQWSQLGIEFGSYNRTHTVYLPPGSTRNCRGTSNTTLELVGAGSYKLTVPTAVFDSGPLSINVSVSLACLELQSHYYCPICSQWRYTSQTSSRIDISAKKGEATDYLPHTQTVCDSIQHYAHIHAQFMHTDGHPKRFRNTWR